MKAWIKRSVILITLIILLAAVFAYRMYNKPYRSIENEQSIVIAAPLLFQEFETNEVEANKKYLDKVVEITGEVSEVSKNQDGKQVIVLKSDNLMFGISCTLETEQVVNVGDMLTMKGFCMGYLSDVVVSKAKIVNK